MDIDALKTFLEVNRTRHFGKAAENLFLSQSAISARIRILEEGVGVPLFTRDRKNIQLTAAGEKMLRYAETILTTWNRARQEIAVNDVDKVPFIVGGVPSLWDINLQGWLEYMVQSLPELVIQAELQNASTLLRQLGEGNMDLAFVFEAPQSSDLEVVEIAKVPLTMVSNRPRLNIAQALQSDYILVDWGSAFAVNHARHFPDMPTPRMRVGQGRVARDYILKAGGTAYLAESMITDELKKKRLHKVKDAPRIERAAYALYPLQSEKMEIVQHALGYFLKRGRT